MASPFGIDPTGGSGNGPSVVYEDGSVPATGRRRRQPAYDTQTQSLQTPFQRPMGGSEAPPTYPDVGRQYFLNSVARNNNAPALPFPALYPGYAPKAPSAPVTPFSTPTAQAAPKPVNPLIRSEAYRNYMTGVGGGGESAAIAAVLGPGGTPTTQPTGMTSQTAMQQANTDLGLMRSSYTPPPTTQPSGPTAYPGASSIPSDLSGRRFTMNPATRELTLDQTAQGNNYTLPRVTAGGQIRPAEQYNPASSINLTTQQATAMWNAIKANNSDPGQWVNHFVQTVGKYGVGPEQAMSVLRPILEGSGQYPAGAPTVTQQPPQAQAEFLPHNGHGGVVDLPNGQRVVVDANGRRVGAPIGQTAPMLPRVTVTQDYNSFPQGYTPINQPPASYAQQRMSDYTLANAAGTKPVPYQQGARAAKPQQIAKAASPQYTATGPNGEKVYWNGAKWIPR